LFAAPLLRHRRRLVPDQQQQPLVASRFHADRNHHAADNDDQPDGPARLHEQCPAWRVRQHRPFIVVGRLTGHAPHRL
jgi:hypothetical protein